jgi:hypothetical protein
VFTARYELIPYIKQVFITVMESVYSAVGLIPYIKQVFITVMESVYSVVRTDSLFKADSVSYLKG